MIKQNKLSKFKWIFIFLIIKHFHFFLPKFGFGSIWIRRELTYLDYVAFTVVELLGMTKSLFYFVRSNVNIGKQVV